ncbi:MAG: hypothetical protein U1F77_11875 [Kiritimatiellia bacterium]
MNAGTLIATTGSALGTNGGLTVGGATFVYKAAAAGPLNLGSGVINLAAGSRIGASVGGTLGQSAITSTAAAVTTGAITVDIYGIPAAPATFGINNLITAASGLDKGDLHAGERLQRHELFGGAGQPLLQRHRGQYRNHQPRRPRRRILEGWIRRRQQRVGALRRVDRQQLGE